MYECSGLLTADVVHDALVASPPLVTGGGDILIGSQIGNKINNAAFTRLSLILVVTMEFSYRFQQFIGVWFLWQCYHKKHGHVQ